MDAQPESPEPLDPRRLPLPPGGRGLPLIGETVEFLRDPAGFRARRLGRYGPVFRANVLGNTIVFAAGAEFNHWIFSGEGKDIENHWPASVRKLLGPRSLAMISGEEHKQRRKLFAPHFKRTAMDAALPAILRVTRAHLRAWEQDGELGPIAVVPRMQALAFEIICAYLFGSYEDLGVPLSSFRQDFNEMMAGLFVAVPYPLPGTSFARAAAARERLFAALDDVVARRDADPSRRGPDVLSTLLEIRDERGEPLAREAIADELHLLMFAGHDTTRVAMSNVLLHLSQHPQALAAARAEQDAHAQPAWELGWIRSLSYLDALIKESMRVIPPIAGAFRRVIRDTSFGGFRIPAGWSVSMAPSIVHSDPRYYAEPERFDPQRWLEQVERPAFAYVPFGGGPRSCLGVHFAELEMRVVLSMLLRDYEWTLIPDQDLSYTVIPLPLPRGGLMVEFARRR